MGSKVLIAKPGHELEFFVIINRAWGNQIFFANFCFDQTALQIAFCTTALDAAGRPASE